MLYCLKCGEELSENDNFCHKCGVITNIGYERGFRKYLGSEIENTLHLASLKIEEGLEKVSEIIKEASEELDPKFEEAKENLQEILEEIKNELSKRNR